MLVNNRLAKKLVTFLEKDVLHLVHVRSYFGLSTWKPGFDPMLVIWAIE